MAAGRTDNPNALEALIRDYRADINAQLRNGSRPIHSASADGTAQHVKVLLDAGAPIGDSNGTGRTPLHWAADRGNWGTVEFLLDGGADVNARAGESGSVTALVLAEKPTWQGAARNDEWDDVCVDKLVVRLKQAVTR